MNNVDVKEKRKLILVEEMMPGGDVDLGVYLLSQGLKRRRIDGSTNINVYRCGVPGWCCRAWHA